MSTTTRGSRIRLSPEQRRVQLLDLGVQLLAVRSLDELSIDVLAEEAGVSRGLLYHYFGGKTGFHEAVVRRAADELIAQTAPPAEGDPLQRLRVSMTAYVDYVAANRAGYLSLVRAAAGNETLRRIRDEVRDVLTDRVLTEYPSGDLVPDTGAVRLMLRGWSALVEDVVLAWVTDQGVVTRDEILALVTDSLPALAGVLPAE